MIEWFDASFPDRVTKTTLYHVVRWLFRAYVVSLLVVGAYSLLWLAEVAGLVPEAWLSTIWLAIAAMGSVFLVLLVPLFYTSRSTDR